MSLGMVLPAVMLLGGLGLALGLPIDGTSFQVLRWLGWGLVVLAAMALTTLVYWIRFPRLAYEECHLLVYLRSTEPIRVPIELVECFFLGQTASMMKGNDEQSQTSTVVVRLAESADSWRQVDVKRALGQWCDGYITIRGTWCEPLNGEVMKRLNDNLIQAHREQRSGREASTS